MSEAKMGLQLKEEYYNLSQVIEMYNKVYNEDKKLFNFINKEGICGKDSYIWSEGSSSFGSFVLLIELLMWLSVDTKFYALTCLTSDNFSTGSIINNFRSFLKVGKLKSDDWMTYIGWCDSNQWYKIGRSKNPFKRCSALGIVPVLILQRDVETVLLSHHKRVKGEWVEYENLKIDNIVIEYAYDIVYYDKVDDSFELERKDVFVDVEFSKDFSIADNYIERVKFLEDYDF